MNDMASNYELAELILKPPLRIIGITAEMVRPVKPEYDEQFSSLEEVYAFFRKKRPKGRWLIWVQGSDGQVMPIDSKKWEERMARIYARSMTKHWFEAYLRRFVPPKTRYDAIKGAWNYFYAFNHPISEEAKEWFEKNIAKLNNLL